MNAAVAKLESACLALLRGLVAGPACLQLVWMQAEAQRPLLPVGMGLMQKELSLQISSPLHGCQERCCCDQVALAQTELIAGDSSDDTRQSGCEMASGGEDSEQSAYLREDWRVTL